MIFLTSCKTVTTASQPSSLFRNRRAHFETVQPTLKLFDSFKTVQVLSWSPTYTCTSNSHGVIFLPWSFKCTKRPLVTTFLCVHCTCKKCVDKGNIYFTFVCLRNDFTIVSIIALLAPHHSYFCCRCVQAQQFTMGYICIQLSKLCVRTCMCDVSTYLCMYV